MTFITAPTIISVLDDSVDTSKFYSIAEEEENGHTKSKMSPFKIEYSETSTNISPKTNQYFNYSFRNYPRPHRNLISPPPEQNIS